MMFKEVLVVVFCVHIAYILKSQPMTIEKKKISFSATTHTHLFGLCYVIVCAVVRDHE